MALNLQEKWNKRDECKHWLDTTYLAQIEIISINLLCLIRWRETTISNLLKRWPVKRKSTEISTVIDNRRVGFDVQMTHTTTFDHLLIMRLWLVWLYAERGCPLAFNSYRWLLFFVSSPICLCQIKLATSYSHLLWRPSTIISQFFLMWAYAHGHFVNILCVRYPNSNRISPPHRIGDTVKAQNASSAVHRHGKKREREKKRERTRNKWRKTNH